MAMYENTREGMIQEYSEKVAAECKVDINSFEGKMNLHFLRGHISQAIDRAVEDPEQFKYISEEEDD